MKVGIIGSGGREHAICLALHASKKIKKIYCFPGNAGTSSIAENSSLNLENFNESSSIRPSTNTDNLVKEIPMANFNPSPVNSASRLSAANIATPITDTGPINPNTMAKGSQLFSGPNEITFAAQGGIMNARKPIQRVA